jgi:hypothetical protein
MEELWDKRNGSTWLDAVVGFWFEPLSHHSLLFPVPLRKHLKKAAHLREQRVKVWPAESGREGGKQKPNEYHARFRFIRKPLADLQAQQAPAVTPEPAKVVRVKQPLLGPCRHAAVQGAKPWECRRSVPGKRKTEAIRDGRPGTRLRQKNTCGEEK